MLVLLKLVLDLVYEALVHPHDVYAKVNFCNRTIHHQSSQNSVPRGSIRKVNVTVLSRDLLSN